MTDTSTLKLRARIYCGDEIAMGPGKADLLQAIEREGSISGAGRAMNMSYRRAWLLVNAMNRCWELPLVETVAGGSQERGARLTDAGKRVLERYRALERRMAELEHSAEYLLLKEHLRAAPVCSRQP